MLAAPTASNHHVVAAASDEAGDGRDAESDERRPLDGAGFGEPGCDETQRSDTGVVGATDAVAVVVGVVHADLQGEADDEGERQTPPDRPPSLTAAPAPRATGTIAAGSVRGRAPSRNARAVDICGRCIWATPADDTGRSGAMSDVRCIATHRSSRRSEHHRGR